MSIGPIPWTAVRQYADNFKLNSENFDYFYSLVKMMDSEYLKYVEREMKSKMKKK